MDLGAGQFARDGRSRLAMVALSGLIALLALLLVVSHGGPHGAVDHHHPVSTHAHIDHGDAGSDAADHDDSSHIHLTPFAPAWLGLAAPYVGIRYRLEGARSDNAPPSAATRPLLEPPAA